MLMSFLTHFIQLLIESAPWLLLGFIIAGLIKGLIPAEWMHKHLGNNSPMTVVKSALIGAPLPLCSCGVIPAAMGLRRAGASKSSTTAFLIATPETGVDSVSITYAFMGWFMAVVRPIAAIITAIVAGLMVRQIDITDAHAHADTDEQNPQSSCCSSKAPEPQESSCCSSKAPEPQKSSCCSSKEQANDKPQQPTWWVKMKEGVQFSLLDLSKDIALWLLIGLLLAAAIRTFIPTEWLTQWGNGWQAFVVMALIGVPMYICATSSTPIAASLLFSGVSPGAVLVFMLVGPATNIATLSLVKQELGYKSLIAYLSSITLVSFVFGWLINLLAANYEGLIKVQIGSHDMGYNAVSLISTFILILLLIRGLWIKFKPQ